MGVSDTTYHCGGKARCAEGVCTACIPGRIKTGLNFTRCFLCQPVAEAFLIFALSRLRGPPDIDSRKDFSHYCYSPRTGCNLSQCTFPSQGNTHRWHCAARREIAERSEEAPEAIAAQPSPICGGWKAQGGKRGECRGGLARGRSPLHRPLLPPPEAAQTT